MRLDATFNIQFTNEAQKHYDALDDNMTDRVNQAIDQLAQGPFFGSQIKKLKGKHAGKYGYRVGSYRVVYDVDKERQRCIIMGISRRSRAYRY